MLMKLNEKMKELEISVEQLGKLAYELNNKVVEIGVCMQEPNPEEIAKQVGKSFADLLAKNGLGISEYKI